MPSKSVSACSFWSGLSLVLATYSATAEFYGSFAASAWFGPSRKLVRSVVIPRAKLFTILLAALQASVATMVLSRGSLVKPGLIAGAVFALAAACVSNVPGALANLALAAIQALLAFTR